jgi:hypothetical protein
MRVQCPPGHHLHGLEFQPAPEGASIRDTRTGESFALLGWHVSPDGRRISACAIRPGSIPAQFAEALQ